MHHTDMMFRNGEVVSELAQLTRLTAELVQTRLLSFLASYRGHGNWLRTERGSGNWLPTAEAVPQKTSVQTGGVSAD